MFSDRMTFISNVSLYWDYIIYIYRSNVLVCILKSSEECRIAEIWFKIIFMNKTSIINKAASLFLFIFIKHVSVHPTELFLIYLSAAFIKKIKIPASKGNMSAVSDSLCLWIRSPQNRQTLKVKQIDRVELLRIDKHI